MTDTQGERDTERGGPYLLQLRVLLSLPEGVEVLPSDGHALPKAGGHARADLRRALRPRRLGDLDVRRERQDAAHVPGRRHGLPQDARARPSRPPQRLLRRARLGARAAVAQEAAEGARAREALVQRGAVAPLAALPQGHAPPSVAELLLLLPPRVLGVVAVVVGEVRRLVARVGEGRVQAGAAGPARGGAARGRGSRGRGVTARRVTAGGSGSAWTPLGITRGAQGAPYALAAARIPGSTTQRLAHFPQLHAQPHLQHNTPLEEEGRVRRTRYTRHMRGTLKRQPEAQARRRGEGERLGGGGI